MVAGRMIAAECFACAFAKADLGVVVEDAGVNRRDQSARRRGAGVTGVRLFQGIHRDCPRSAHFSRQAVPLGQTFLEDVAHHVGVLPVPVRQNLTVGGEAVNTLSRTAARTLAAGGVGDLAEELALPVLPAALVPVITGYGDVLFVGHADNVAIG